jgi:hypothetical protein
MAESFEVSNEPYLRIEASMMYTHAGSSKESNHTRQVRDGQRREGYVASDA